MLKNWRDVRVYGSSRFRRARIVTLRTQCRLLCNCGYIHRAGNHAVIAIMSQASLNAQIVRLFGAIVFIIIF
jgi:hypothetical protein